MKFKFAIPDDLTKMFMPLNKEYSNIVKAFITQNMLVKKFLSLELSELKVLKITIVR